MRALVLLAFTFSALSVHAIEPMTFCAKDFAAIARTEEEILTITAESYEQLLELIRDPAAKQRALDHILANNDPFSLPKDDRELAGIEKPLAQLREMLKELKWESPALTEKMIEVARQRSQGAAEAKVKVEQATKVNVGIKRLRFPMPEADFAQQSPDGRYFYTVHETSKGTEIVTFDTVTEKTESTLITNADGASGYSTAVSADGTKLVLAVNRSKSDEGSHVFQVHDLVNGKPNPKGTRITVSPRLDAKSATAAKSEIRMIQKVHRLANPNWILGEIFHEDADGARLVRFHLVDLAKGKTFPLDPAPEGVSWAPIEGTNAFELIGDRPAPKMPRSMQIVEIGADGKMVVKSIPLHEGVPDSVPTMQAHGDHIALPDEKKGEVVVYHRQTGATVSFPAARPQKKPVRPHGILHPNGKELAVLEIDQTRQLHVVYWYDMANQKKLAEFTLPLGSLNLSPDGESFVVPSEKDVLVVPVLSLLSGIDRP